MSIKLTLVNKYGRYEIETNQDDGDITHMFEMFEGVLLAAGFQKGSIENYYEEG